MNIKTKVRKGLSKLVRKTQPHTNKKTEEVKRTTRGRALAEEREWRGK